MSEPTKGPYFLYQDNGYMHIYPEMWLGEPNREVRKGLIAGVSPWDGAFQHNRSEWMAEAVANGHLLASSWAMREALQRTMTRIASMHDRGSWVDAKELGEIATDIRAALAASRGEAKS